MLLKCSILHSILFRDVIKMVDVGFDEDIENDGENPPIPFTRHA